MKYLSILWRFFKGIRLDALMLIVMMTWAMLTGVLVHAKAESIHSDVRVLESADTERAYVVMDFDSPPMDISDNVAVLEATLEEEDIVEQVFSIRVANPVSYNGYRISIVLYEPGMLEFFPQLKRDGFNFDKYPDGCILGSTTFSGYRAGDSINLKFGNPGKAKYAPLTVAGRINVPYRHMELSSAATNPHASDLFTKGEVLIMQGTDSVLAKLAELGVSITHNMSLVTVFRDGTSKKSQEHIFQKLAPSNLVFPMQQLIDSSNEQLEKTLKEALPQPLFLAVSAMMAYLSIVVLIFKKKEKELAILHLCGASRKRCAFITFLTCQCIALVPLVINAILIPILPSISWSLEELFTAYLDTLTPDQLSMRNNVLIQAIHGMLQNCKFGLSSLWVLLGYYLTTVLIALGATMASMAKHTPLTYLRGASE